MCIHKGCVWKGTQRHSGMRATACRIRARHDGLDGGASSGRRDRRLSGEFHFGANLCPVARRASGMGLRDSHQNLGGVGLYGDGDLRPGCRRALGPNSKNRVEGGVSFRGPSPQLADIPFIDSQTGFRKQSYLLAFARPDNRLGCGIEHLHSEDLSRGSPSAKPHDDLHIRDDWLRPAPGGFKSPAFQSI